MTRTILDCPACARLPQKSNSDRLPAGAAALVDAPAETKRCPECGTFYVLRALAAGDAARRELAQRLLEDAEIPSVI